MTDINTYIMHLDHGIKSPEVLDRELELGDWSRSTAQILSENEGIRLTQDHWQVIDYLQGYYLAHGWPQSTHTMAQTLDAAFAARGGARFLYQLFPKGPLAQGSRLAGLPMPHNATDDSLGSVQ